MKPETSAVRRRNGAMFGLGAKEQRRCKASGRSTQGVIVFDTAGDEHVVSVEHIGYDGENGENGNGG
jgi:hypothetical protein